MEPYLDLVADALVQGSHESTRTGVDTIATFGRQYEVDLADGYPLLTTKRMDDYRWESMIHEFLWYLSGEAHIRRLSEHTGIWDAWADEEDHLDTAYGRFWRRFPVPETPARLPGEHWSDDDRWVTEEADGRRVFDQIQYVIDTLKENPRSRRMVVSAWHPANAAGSTLPPCHYTFVFSVQNDRLHCQLHQRSGDIALGVPFNIAAYSLMLTAVAQQTGFEPGRFSHSLVDAHIYCGQGARGAWYAEHLPALQERLRAVETPEEYLRVRDWIQAEAPPDPEDNDYDHVPGLLTQLSRTPKARPELAVADKPLDALAYDDIELRDYESHPAISFAVAE